LRSEAVQYEVRGDGRRESELHYLQYCAFFRKFKNANNQESQEKKRRTTQQGYLRIYIYPWTRLHQSTARLLVHATLDSLVFFGSWWFFCRVSQCSRDKHENIF